MWRAMLGRIGHERRLAFSQPMLLVSTTREGENTDSGEMHHAALATLLSSGLGNASTISLFTHHDAMLTVEQSFEAQLRDLQVIIHAMYVMPDHVHLACSIPPRWAIANVVNQVKGTSSHRLNHTVFGAGDLRFAWQAEYGVYSYTERALADVVAYVQHQPERHRANDLWAGFERAEREWSPNSANPPLNEGE